MASKSIKAILTLKDKNFTSNMKKASGGVNGFNRRLKHSSNQVRRFKRNVTSSFSSIAKSAIGLAGVYIGFRALSNGISESVEAAKAQIDAETKLIAVMKNTKGMTEKNARSVMKYASELQNVGVIGDEVAISGVQQLATYQLQEATLKKLMPGMNDLIAQQKGLNATQQDSVTIGNMIGKVMNGQVGALSRAGINFTKAQEKILKYGTETQKAATLAEVLEMNVGGVNKAIAETDQGKIQQMKNAWGDYKEEVGKKILPLQAKLANWFFKKIPGIQAFVTRAIDKGIQAFGKIGSIIDTVKEKMKGIKQWGVDAWTKIKGVIDENRPTLDKVKGVLNDIGKKLTGLKEKFVSAFQNEGISWFKDTALPAITEGILGVVDKATDLYNFVNDNWGTLEPLILGIAGAIGTYKLAMLALKVPTLIATGLTNGLALAQGALNTVMAISPIGWLAIGIGALIAIGVALYKNWDTIKEKAGQLWEGIKAALSPIGDFFIGIWEGVKTGFKSFINFFIGGINKVISGVNSIKVEIPDWVPEFGGKEFGISIPKIPKFALGTSYFDGGLARINERGGEIVNLPNGSQVIPADKSEKIINNTQNISGLEGLLKLLQEIIQVLREIKNRKSGDIVININGSNMTVDEVANQLVPKIKLALANS
ncbi:hypothetical protein [Marinisporobacter balticus]|uniref:Uncharacterized protein n=1 Tax=Marinisporobacter balticus TaxID=2018667 RepID=A0A4R2KGE4_9FIRM|nr:hypothetical protein [Marinisporobacter balticus]TCO69499.1 hypothetical protein EV214_13123 [Marinisporobacter balticus]